MTTVTIRPRIVGRLTLPGFRAKVSSPPTPSKHRAPALVAVLAEKWPAVFGGGATKPLKLGIYAEIQAALAGTVSNKQLAKTLGWWCARGSYLTALSQPDARRRGLDGSDAGPVSDEHREMAAKQLAERRARR
jgi:sRNA-binding protein